VVKHPNYPALGAHKMTKIIIAAVLRICLQKFSTAESPSSYKQKQQTINKGFKKNSPSLKILKKIRM
jgi:hypothetical protein